jgi:hypothetical protein
MGPAWKSGHLWPRTIRHLTKRALAPQARKGRHSVLTHSRGPEGRSSTLPLCKMIHRRKLTSTLIWAPTEVP